MEIMEVLLTMAEERLERVDERCTAVLREYSESYKNVLNRISELTGEKAIVNFWERDDKLELNSDEHKYLQEYCELLQQKQALGACMSYWYGYMDAILISKGMDKMYEK